MKSRDCRKPFQSLPLRNDMPNQRRMFRMQTAIAERPRNKPARIEHYPVVPFSRMAQTQDIPFDRYPNLSSYISGRTGAHPSISDAVALVLLNQFLSIPVDFYSQEPYTRPQRVFSREQLDEFMDSIRVFEISFTSRYWEFDHKLGRTGSFRTKTVVPESSYPDMLGQIVKPSHGFDITYILYEKGTIPGKDELEDECSIRLAEGKYREELGVLSNALYLSCLDLPKEKADALFKFAEAADDSAIASEQFFALATRCEEEATKLAPAIIDNIRRLGEQIARIESEVDSMLGDIPTDPKGLIETIAKHVVRSEGALIVSGCDTPPDNFRTIKSFQNGSVVLYQKND